MSHVFVSVAANNAGNERRLLPCKYLEGQGYLVSWFIKGITRLTICVTGVINLLKY